MRASRTERGSRAVAAAALLTAALGGPAAAQIGPPISLVPQAAPAPVETAPAASGSAAPDAADHDQGGVRAEPLAPMDASWHGTLGQDQGAMPRTMWRGTARAFLAAVLPQLAPSTSPVLQDLARRLLLSDAQPPGGADAPDRPSIAAERLDRLLALGDVGGATAIMDALPAEASGDSLERTRIELRFAANDRSGACDAVQDRIARYQTPWWDRALIACQALAGERDQAALGLSLLREQKAPPDAGFDALIGALDGRAHKLEKLADPSPMRLALLAAAKLPLPAAALAAASPAALLAYAGNEDVPLERRLPAAERAAALGAMTPDALGALYRKLETKPADETAAMHDGKLPEDARSRAILYAVARSSAPAETRAAAITALLDGARKHGLFPFTAALVAPALDELTPGEVSAAFSAEAAQALLVAGPADAAKPWLDAAQSRTLRLLAELGAPGPAETLDSAGLLHDAVAELAGRDAAAAPARADLLVALLAAFGETVATPDWAPLLAPPHEARLPDAALWVDLQQATADKRVGETVLDSILVLQAGDRLSLEPVVLGRVIAGLRAVGLEAEARALALEAAVDAGV